MRTPSASECHFQPSRRRRAFEVAAQVRQLLKLGRHDGSLRHILIGDAARISRTARGKRAVAISTAGNLAAENFPLADQLRGKLRRAAVFAARTAQNESVSAVFHYRVGMTLPVSARDLRDRLKPKHAPASELAQ